MSTSLLLNHYQVVGVLYEEASVSVVHAFDTQANRDVAVKILSAARVPDPALYQALEGRFTRESEVGSRTGGHPNLVAVYDFAGDASQTLYLVLEYLPAGTLGYRIQSGPLSVSDALAVSADIARGLQVAHQVGVMHTALTPAAVFLAGDSVKVGEFGDAQIDNVPASLPPTVDMAYLSRYRAPELNAAMSHTGPESDQYSLGMILFEMLTGVPHHSLDPGGAANALAAQPRPVAALFERLTQPAPQARYPLMRDVLAAIEAVRNTLGATAPLSLALPASGAPPPPAPTPAGKRRVRRRAVLAGIAGVAALGAAGAGGVFLYENRKDSTGATSTPPPATPTAVPPTVVAVAATVPPTPVPTAAPTLPPPATPTPVPPTIARTFPPQPTLTSTAVTADMSDQGQWLIAETATIITTLKDNAYTVQVFKKPNGKGTVAWGDWVPKNVKLAPKFNSEVSMKLLGAPPTTAGGILFNFNYISQREQQQFMLFLIRGDGRYGLFQQTPGGNDPQARVDFSNSFPLTFAPNAPVLAGVEVRGDQLSCYANRQQVIKIPLPAEIAGFSALALAAQVQEASIQPDISIVFTNLRYEPITS